MFRRLKEFWAAIRRGEYGSGSMKDAMGTAYKRGHKIGYDFMEDRARKEK